MLTVPIKARIKHSNKYPDRFDLNVNAQFAIGLSSSYNFILKRWGIFGFAGLSTITNPIESEIEGGEPQNKSTASFSYGIGIAGFLYDVQLGFVWGWDLAYDKPSTWYYQKTPWWSFSIGFKFFTF